MAADQERSKGGCWTCKLRKKKCDEAPGSCAVCLSFDIDCLGYGPRQAWMDGGSVEKAQLQTWRAKVKEVTNKKRKLKARQLARRQRDPYGSDHISEDLISQERDTLSSHSEPPSAVYSTAVTTLPITTTTRFTLWSLSQVEPVTDDNHGLRPQSRNEERTPLLPIQSEEEAGLLMHYLDHVFPLQFPFYRHSTSKCGRGWLLSLLLLVEPLYHAALSVSCYHKHFEELAEYYELRHGIIYNLQEVPRCPRLESQLSEYTLTISRISDLLARIEKLEETRSELQLREYVELISCMATVISLEIFEGGSSGSWQMHLNAATYILPLAHAAFQSEQVESLSNTHREAYKFFSSALMWYKLQSYTTSGSLLGQAYVDIQLSCSCMPLSEFAGCDDWVIEEALNIIKLARWKEAMLSKKQLSIRELIARASEIDSRMRTKMTSLSVRIDCSSAPEYFNDSFEYTRLLVTRIFGYSILVYLYVVESGPCPNVPEIHSTVSKAIEALQALPQPELIRGLSWPLCIAGSMAAEDQQPAIIQIAMKAEIERRPFGSSKHAVTIMKECWRMRGEQDAIGKNVDWGSAMRNLDLNIVLT